MFYKCLSFYLGLKTILKILPTKTRDKLKKGNNEKKKIITTNPSNNEFNFPILIKWFPEKYKITDVINKTNNCLMVSLSIIIGV